MADMGRAFSPSFFGASPGALPAGWYEVAPLALAGAGVAWQILGVVLALQKKNSSTLQKMLLF
jgi:hypothetical protein